MPSGAAIVAGHTDGTVRIWSLNTGTDVRVYKGHTEAVKTVACSPDGQLIASGGMDKTVRVWRVFPEAGI
jgi:WD40 repeat protein